MHLAFRGDKILRHFDEDVRDFLQNSLKTRGINLHTGFSISSVESGTGILPSSAIVPNETNILNAPGMNVLKETNEPVKVTKPFY